MSEVLCKYIIFKSDTLVNKVLNLFYFIREFILLVQQMIMNCNVNLYMWEDFGSFRFYADDIYLDCVDPISIGCVIWANIYIYIITGHGHNWLSQIVCMHKFTYPFHISVVYVLNEYTL